MELKREMEVDLTDTEILCWLFGCYDIEEDDGEENDDEHNNGKRV